MSKTYKFGIFLFVAVSASSGDLIISLPIDSSLGEKLQKNEWKDIKKTMDVQLAFMRDKYEQSELARRDFHARSPGCVIGEIQVHDHLNESYYTSVFTKSARLPTVLRFSMGSANPNSSDEEKSLMGLAVKIFVDNDIETYMTKRGQTVDFLGSNAPFFPLKNPKQNLAALSASGIWQQLIFAATNIDAIIRLRRLIHRPEHPFEDYHSGVPFKWGEYASKYKWQSCEPFEGNVSSIEDPTRFIAQMLREHVSQNGLCLALKVQQDTSGIYNKHTEDASFHWDEDKIPFVEVARFVADPQSVESENRVKNCENLSFNPGRVPEDHKPLGGINRVRHMLYNAIREYRHRINGVVAVEPMSVFELDQ